MVRAAGPTEVVLISGRAVTVAVTFSRVPVSIAPEIVAGCPVTTTSRPVAFCCACAATGSAPDWVGAPGYHTSSYPSAEKRRKYSPGNRPARV